MTAVRIAQVTPQPGELGTGEFQTMGFLVVLADDAGRRAVPVWLWGEPGVDDLAELIGQAEARADEIVAAAPPQRLTAQLLDAVGGAVTGVDIEPAGLNAGGIDTGETGADETGTGGLDPDNDVARVTVRGTGGTSHVSAGLSTGLALAAATGAPVRIADDLMNRVAEPVTGDDLISPFLGRVPLAARAGAGHGPPGWLLGILPGQRPRFEPRNLDFAAGLDRWDLDTGAFAAPDRKEPDRGEAAAAGYAATTDGPSAVLSATVSRPPGSASLVQAIYADDYRGTTAVFRGDIRTAPGTVQCGLRLEIFRHRWRSGRGREDHGATVAGLTDWTTQQIVVPVPADADLIRFGVTLTGPGQVTLRHPDLRRIDPGHADPGGAPGAS
ncbi:MAG TPA: hypothetical protein VGJ19_12755 [Streptosporangiaceae bacterium]